MPKPAKKLSLLSELLERPASLRPPSWRWLVLLDYLVSAEKDLEPLMVDKALYDAAIFMRKRRFNADSKLTEGARHSRTAYWLFMDNRPYGRKWALEALLLTKASFATISRNFQDLSEQDIWYYQRLFFDVQAYLDKPIEVVTHILHAARADAIDSNEYDLIWKTFAYRFGYEAFRQYLQIGLIDPMPEYVKWLHELRETRLIERACQLSQNARTMFTETASEVFKHAQASMKFQYTLSPMQTDTDSNADNAALPSYQRFVSALSEAVELTISSREIQLPAIELLPNMQIQQPLLLN